MDVNQLIDSLASCLKSVIDDNSPMKQDITNPSYTRIYLNLFLNGAKANNGNPISYDSFGSKLFMKLIEGYRLNKNDSRFIKKTEEFSIVWTAWVALFNKLKEEPSYIEGS